jgi:hypothetical protein
VGRDQKQRAGLVTRRRLYTSKQQLQAFNSNWDRRPRNSAAESSSLARRVPHHTTIIFLRLLVTGPPPPSACSLHYLYCIASHAGGCGTNFLIQTFTDAHSQLARSCHKQPLLDLGPVASSKQAQPEAQSQAAGSWTLALPSSHGSGTPATSTHTLTGMVG